MVKSQMIAVLILCAGISGYERSSAQTPAPKKQGVAAARVPVYANLAQLMRGTLFPASNVFFAAQNLDPSKVQPAKDPSLATDPLANSYGQWQAVENSALAIAETADLLTLTGRKCSNGLDVPIRNPDWPKFVQELRDAAMTAYKAAQTKNQDTVTDAAGTLSVACSNCHDKYREKPTLADRCK